MSGRLLNCVMDEPNQTIRSFFRRDSFGRYVVWPSPAAIAFGRMFRRARLMAGYSQRALAARSGVSQSVISRFERGMAPGMSVERLVILCDALAPHMPFGFCPHEHRCAWPLIPPVQYDRSTGKERPTPTPVLHPAEWQARELSRWIPRLRGE